MKWFNKFNWFGKDTSQEDANNTNAPKRPCLTPELTEFIQQYVTEERLEPMVESFVTQNDDCGCGCSTKATIVEDTLEISSDTPISVRIATAIPELEVLLAGHKAWCIHIEQIMRENKSSEYNLATVGSSLMCCIGQWLQCEGKSLQHYQEYQDLVSAYEQFHACAGEMLIKHKKGYLAEAIKSLRSDFAESSEKVQLALQALVNKMRSDYQADNDTVMDGKNRQNDVA